jgi:cytochrome c5
MRVHRLAYAAICGALVAAIACGNGGIEHLSDLGTNLDGGDGVVLGPDNQPAPTGAAGTGLVTGLPCDVQAVVENRCKSCHDGATAGTPRLLDYADFKQPSKGDPTKTMAEIALLRMQKGEMPPAPAEPPNDQELLVFQEWVTAGTPKGGLCTDPPPAGGDAGSSVDASLDAAPTCASGLLWTMGNTGSPAMHPGDACNACHSASKGPNLTFAGTVYRGGLHDIDDCNGTGAPAPLTVVITDKNGQTATLVVNDAGNFFLEAPQRDGGAREAGGGNGGGGNGGGGGAQRFRAPFHAKVVSGATQRAMMGSVTSGDCNACHTSAGINGAPGRILAP